jgi:hypothetical protein
MLLAQSNIRDVTFIFDHPTLVKVWFGHQTSKPVIFGHPTIKPV